MSLGLGFLTLIAALANGAGGSAQERKKDLHQVTLFEDIDFGGRSVVLHKDLAALAKRDFNDVTSSMRWNLPLGTAVVLYTDNDFESPAIVLVGKGEVGNFDAFPDAHDAISSVAFLPTGKGGYPKGIAKNLPKLGSE